MSTYTYESPESKAAIAQLLAIISEHQPIQTRHLFQRASLSESTLTRFTGHMRKLGLIRSRKTAGGNVVAWELGRCSRLDQETHAQAPHDGKPVVRHADAAETHATVPADPLMAALFGRRPG